MQHVRRHVPPLSSACSPQQQSSQCSHLAPARPRWSVRRFSSARAACWRDVAAARLTQAANDQTSRSWGGTAPPRRCASANTCPKD